MTSGTQHANSTTNDPPETYHKITSGTTGGFSFICIGTVVRGSLRLNDPAGIVTGGPVYRTLGAAQGSADSWEIASYDYANNTGQTVPLSVSGSCNGQWYESTSTRTPPTTPTGPGGGGSGGL